MSPPLAVLNVEELHWQSDLGLPNQRRWLNHRNTGDEHRRTFPSAAVDSITDYFRLLISDFGLILTVSLFLRTGITRRRTNVF